MSDKSSTTPRDSYPLSDADALPPKISLVLKLARLFKTGNGRQTREAVFAGAGRQVLNSETGSTDALSESLKQHISSIAIGNSDLARFHVPIDAYEGKHRFDPDAEWTAEEERVLVRRVCDTTLKYVFLPLTRSD